MSIVFSWKRKYVPDECIPYKINIILLFRTVTLYSLPLIKNKNIIILYHRITTVDLFHVVILEILYYGNDLTFDCDPQKPG
jgi:hypothetical protein